MPKTIYALRHAKAAPATGVMHDQERPLNTHGIEAALKLGEYMKKQKLTPGLVLCSSAIRTRQTLEFLLEGYGKPLPTQFLDKFYLAESKHFFTGLAGVNDGVDSVLIISHNPGIHAFCIELINDGRREALEEIELKFPTAAMAAIEVDIKRWQDIRLASGYLKEFIQPKEM